MNTKSMTAALALGLSINVAHTQNTAFTYQGRLTDNGAPADGTYSLRLILYNAEFGGSQVGPTLTNEPVAVTGGLFTTALDFGAAALDGNSRWLEIAVRTNGSASVHQPLSPRQPLTSTPYAFHAANAGTASSVTGTVSATVTFNNPANSFSGSFIGGGAGLADVNAAMLGGVAPSNFWQTVGNYGANSNWYLGTADYAPLELRVNGRRAFRCLPTSNNLPNIVAGSSNNVVDGAVRGSTIGGGSFNSIQDGTSNTLLIGENPGSSSVIGGGYGNSVRGNSELGAIGGGGLNEIRDGTANTISGGTSNIVQNADGYSVVCGGFGNTSTGNYAVVPGGWRNLARGDYCFAAGRRGRALHDGSFVWADAKDTDFNSTSENEFAVRASGGVRFETAGAGMTLDRQPVLAGSVRPNQLSGTYSNAVSFTHPSNSFTGSFTGNGAGLSSVNAATLDGLAASNFWRLGGNAGTTNTFLGTTDNQPLEFRVNNQRILRLQPASSSPNIVGGFSGNSVSNNARGSVIVGGGSFTFANIIGEDVFPVTSSAIVGGIGNRIADDYGFIGGGLGNLIDGRYSAIAGGLRNRCDDIGRYSFIGGGQTNYIDSEFCFIGGGTNNQIDTFSWNSVIGGGRDNLIDAFCTNSVIGGGWSNRMDFSASFATIPGGAFNLVDGKHGFAAGYRAKVRHNGAFVLADFTEADFASTGNNQFLIRANGGVGVNIAQPRGELHVGNSSNAAPISAASQTIIIEHAAENGRAAFLALAGPGASTSTNRVELELEANENERRAIIGTTSNHEIQIRQNNTTRMTVEVGGNIGINTGNPTERLHVIGNILASGTITPNSDRNAKTDVKPVNPGTILERVAKLPIQQWRFKTEAEDVKHVGPMAQDFRAAFGLGAHATAIATVDADGVALAAIQGLNQKLTEELNRRDAENAELKARLANLEKLISKLTSNEN